MPIYDPSTRSGQALYYVGTTVNLQHRIQKHNNDVDDFTKKHWPATLVYFEEYETEE